MWGDIVGCARWCTVSYVCGCGDSALPKSVGHSCTLEHRAGSFRDRPVRPLGDAVLLRRVRCGELVFYSLFLDVLLELR